MPHVGFGRSDITPAPGLPMVGMPGSPRGEGVQWPLRSRVFLVDDGDRRVAAVCLDLIALVSKPVAELRQRLAIPGEIAPENIFIACSHTHRAPFTGTGWGAAEEPTRSYLELVFARTGEAMGSALANKADEAMQPGHPLAVDRIGVASTRLRIPQRRPTTEQVELARWYLEERPADRDELAFTRRIYGHNYTFNDGQQVGNERHAQEPLTMWQWQGGKSDEEPVEEVEMQIIALGDAAIVGFPVELFSDFGRRVKTESPFPDTFIATLANGWHGYAPTREAFTRGGYEPRFAYPSRLAPEAGDRMTEAALELLRSLSSAGDSSHRWTPSPAPDSM